MPLRLGLCCGFVKAPIKFRTTTAAAVQQLERQQGLQKLAEICLHNATTLLAALDYCVKHGIGCFRINSQIMPLRTHPKFGYRLEDLPDWPGILKQFQACGEFAAAYQLRLTFHPDQFVVLSSPYPHVVRSSVEEIEYQAEVAQWIGADVINIHGGGGYGNKHAALERLARSLDLLTPHARRLLTIENDERVYTPADLLPLCRSHRIPLVYDVHHHRCHSDALSIEQATQEALSTWPREPLVHLSSPLSGWHGPTPERHRDYIRLRDFPACWRPLTITIEVEAKAKELAVQKLARWMNAIKLA